MLNIVKKLWNSFLNQTVRHPILMTSVVAITVVVPLAFQNCGRAILHPQLLALPAKASPATSQDFVFLSSLATKGSCSIVDPSKKQGSVLNPSSRSYSECEAQCKKTESENPGQICQFEGKQFNSIHGCQVKDQSGNSVAVSAGSKSKECFSVCASNRNRQSLTCLWGQFKFQSSKNL